jgi:hypothetical protein
VKPDFAHLAPDTADRLSRKQAETLLLLHLTQPTLARGIPASVFKALLIGAGLLWVVVEGIRGL